MASLWEISIKASLGKLNFPPADDPDLPALLCAEGFDVQPISWFVIRRANQFPWHNPDPFDRYIAAEAPDGTAVHRSKAGSLRSRACRGVMAKRLAKQN